MALLTKLFTHEKSIRFITYVLFSLLVLTIQAQQSDPYEKGQTGEMTLWVSSADPNYGIYAYDYDNDREMGQYDGSWKTYPTISIGEYEITSKNLLLHYRDKWSVAMGWVTNSQATIDQMNREYNGKDNVNLGTFNDINGSYVTLYNEASSYRNAFKIYNKARSTQLPGWDLISSTDFFQMFGQAPAITSNPVTNILNFLGANKTDVPADYTADWFEYKNTSGFTMTPLGRRHSNQEGVAGQKWFGYKVESTFRLKDYPTGMILFNRNTGIDISSNLYHFSQARYSRPKTDQELGYKIYIDNCNDSVVMYPLSKVTKLTELPKGLERGIVLRYANREHMKVLRKWSQIRQEADLIRQAVPAIPAMAPLAVSPCEEREPEITPDPYTKGKTSSVLINIGARGDGSYGLTGWNYDTQKVEQSNVITKTYKTIEASEYQWTTENLRLKYGIYASINMNWVNLTQGDVDKFSADYLGGRSIPLDEFEQVYGTWATLYDVAMMYRNIYWGVPTGVNTFDHTWGLPTKEDIWQLYGQTPRKTNNLYEDIKEFLFASSTDFNFGWTGGLFNRKNTSGLSLTPLGMRESYQGGQSMDSGK